MGGSSEDPAERPPKRLLIVDDHELVRGGLRGLLGREPDFKIVGEAGNGREALEKSLSLAPDLILMDVRMPVMDGLQATRAVKGKHPEISVLMVTMHDDPDYMLEAIRAGAAGYVLKDASHGELTASVRRALDGDIPMVPEVAARLLQRLAREAGDGTRDARAGQRAAAGTTPREPLTAREHQTLILLTRGQTNDGIARSLEISVPAARTHVRRVIAKLGVSDRTQAAVRAVELRLASPGE